MRNAYDHNHNKNIPLDQRNIIYLPMLCRLSLKDVKENNYQNHYYQVNDPSSPKVSCIGQVKIRSSNRVLSPTTTVNHHHRLMKHTAKPRKSSVCSFPNKTPLHNTKSRTDRSVGNRDSRNSMMMRRDDHNHTHPCYYYKKKDDGDRECVDISNMDPPLPVLVKKMNVVSEVNLWKRRFNGDRHHELKGLKIEQLRLGNCTMLNKPPTTV